MLSLLCFSLCPALLLGWPIDHVFIIHYTPLVDRKQVLSKRLVELDIEGEWVEKWDGNALPPGSMEEHFSRYRFVDKSHQDHMHFSAEHMLNSELSVALKHFYAFKQIVEKELPLALVLEDDVILKDDFKEQVASYIEQVNEDEWDLLSIGAGLFGECSHDCQNRRKGTNVYRKAYSPQVPSHILGYNNLFRSLDAYVLTLNCAKELYKEMLPLAFPMDCMLNYVLNSQNLKVYWSEPVLVLQGSVEGQFDSVMQHSSSQTSHEDQVTIYNEALGINPAHSAAVYGALGQALSGLDRRDESKHSFLLATKLSPSDETAWSRLGGALYPEDIAGALGTFKQATNINPSYADGWQNLGICQQRMSNSITGESSRHFLEEAVQSLSFAFALQPTMGALVKTVAESLKKLGRYEEASHWYERLGPAFPQQRKIQQELGISLQRAGKESLDAAHVCYLRALSAEPSSADVLSNLGALLQTQGKLDEAGHQYARAVSTQPSHVNAAFNLAGIFRAQKRAVEAMDMYGRILNHNPTHAQSHLHLGAELQAAGRGAEAKAAFENAVHFDPNLMSLFGQQ
jgi:tetratricopeptide (TPR) repeat protein